MRFRIEDCRLKAIDSGPARPTKLLTLAAAALASRSLSCVARRVV
jgi:hypothetical protein